MTERAYRISQNTHLVVSVATLASIIVAAWWIGVKCEAIQQHIENDYMWKDHVKFIRILGRDNPTVNVSGDLDVARRE